MDAVSRLVEGKRKKKDRQVSVITAKIQCKGRYSGLIASGDLARIICPIPRGFNGVL